MLSYMNKMEKHTLGTIPILSTYAISTYHHLRCEFESRSGEVSSIQLYVIKFAMGLR
jgi:hypothetical protein